MDTQMTWGDLGLNDNGKLLFTYYSASRFGGPEPINMEMIDFYIYILRLKNIVPFNYQFRFDPFPYSETLQEDIYGLLSAGYLEKKSPIRLSDKGREFVKSNLPEQDGEILLKPVAEELKRLEGLKPVDLIKEVHSLLFP